jgi:hypothetical protein
LTFLGSQASNLIFYAPAEKPSQFSEEAFEGLKGTKPDPGCGKCGEQQDQQVELPHFAHRGAKKGPSTLFSIIVVRHGLICSALVILILFSPSCS